MNGKISIVVPRFRHERDKSSDIENTIPEAPHLFPYSMTPPWKKKLIISKPTMEKASGMLSPRSKGRARWTLFSGVKVLYCRYDDFGYDDFGYSSNKFTL